MHGAVLAEASVKRDENARKALLGQILDVPLFGIERMRVDALLAQRGVHHAAALERDVALRGFAAHEHGNLAEIHAGSPTTRTSVESTTPFIW